jgi:gamma-glutamyltranspeptidase/glutathione hydrolase
MRAFDLPGRSPVYSENGMAATSHPRATMTARSVLKEGGNAVDAAIAASATLCVVEPHMTGIGGDCFVILAEPDGSLHGLNGSGRAPALVTGEWYRARFKTVPLTGVHSVTTPGAIRAWETLLERFGTLGFDRLFADAIRYAEEGFAIHPRVARDWALYAAELATDEGASRHCLVDGGAPLLGTRHRSPALGATLRKLAGGGAKAFYEGEIAREIADTVQAKGGFLSEEDLAGVTADWIKPISTDYAGHEVFELPPNGQGVTALILLNLLSELDFASLASDSPERRHMEIEAGRLAYAARDRYVADPAMNTAEVERLLSPQFTRSMARQVDRTRRNPAVTLPEMADADTVYLTVVDRDRRAVSFINSLYHAFGSKVVTPRSGIALQNRGACFTLEEGHPNEIGPSKRPLHTIIPAIAYKDGKPAVSFGVMGGAYQPLGHAHVFSNLVDHGMDPQAAIDDARLFWSADGTVEVEDGIDAASREALRARGHAVRPVASPLGGGQMIVIDRKTGFLVGGSDPRKDGLALGW